MPKIESQSRAITLYLFVKIYSFAIPEHSFTISTHIPSLKKIYKGVPKTESEKQFLTSIKGGNSALICQNLPVHNPRTLLRNINSHSKFEENWLKNAENENNVLTDRHTDGRTHILTGQTLMFRIVRGHCKFMGLTSQS